MTVSEILRLAGFNVDDTIDAVDGGMAWLNEGLAALGVNAMLFTTTTIEALEAWTFYPLPTNALDVVEVLDVDNEPYLDYSCRSGGIRFIDLGTYTVTCRKMPAAVTSTNEVPEVHEAYHSVMALFVASRYKSRDDDENQDAVRLMQEFAAGVGRVSAMLRRQTQKTPGVITVIR